MQATAGGRTINRTRSGCSRSPSHPHKSAAKAEHGVFGPDKFWGQVLPSSAAGPEPFAARVERAWRSMRNMFFTPKEHPALAEAMGRLVS